MKHHIRFTAHAVVALTAVTSIALLSSVALMGSAAEEGEQPELDLQFYATPLQVVNNEKIRLDWEGEDAVYCTASGSWSGKKEVAGSASITARLKRKEKKKTEIFTLQCFDNDGNASKKITKKVEVVANKKALTRKKLPRPMPEVDGNSHAREGETITLAWSSSKGTLACRASGPDDWRGLKPPKGTGSFAAEPGEEYALTCWNENGEESKKAATHIVKQKPSRYTAADVGLGSDYFPLYPDDAALKDGTTVYFIDFVRKEENDANTDEDDRYYFGKRIVINPYINIPIEDKAVLTQLYALPSQVPPDVSPSSKLIKATSNRGERTMDDLDRFKNVGEDSNTMEIPTIAFDDFGKMAIDHTLDYLELPREDLYRQFYTSSLPVIWFDGSRAGSPMYVSVDVFNAENEKILTVVMDPYTGENLDNDVVTSIYENGIWDRTIMTVRTMEGSQQELPTVIKGEPVSNPPTQTPVIPEVKPVPETKKEEQKKEEQKTSTGCQAGYTYSSIFGCYKDASSGKEEKKQEEKKETESKKTCGKGEVYSFTFGGCVKE